MFIYITFYINIYYYWCKHRSVKSRAPNYFLSKPSARRLQISSPSRLSGAVRHCERAHDRFSHIVHLSPLTFPLVMGLCSAGGRLRICSSGFSSIPRWLCSVLAYVATRLALCCFSLPVNISPLPTSRLLRWGGPQTSLLAISIQGLIE